MRHRWFYEEIFGIAKISIHTILKKTLNFELFSSPSLLLPAMLRGTLLEYSRNRENVTKEESLKNELVDVLSRLQPHFAEAGDLIAALES